MLTAFHGNARTARILIEAGADINSENYDSQNALHLGTGACHPRIVRLLLEYGATWGKPAVGNRHAINSITSYENKYWLDRVNALFEGPECANTQCDIANKRYAILEQAIIKTFISAGADINTADKDGQTPLGYCLLWNYHEAAEILLSRGADPNIGTPLTGYEVEEYTLLLLKAGANPNIPSADYNTTPLIISAGRLGSPNKMKWLIECGAEVNYQDCSGATALHECARYGAPEQLKILIKNGANINCQDNSGRTPLHCAIRKRHPVLGMDFDEANTSIESINMLLDAGASHDIADNNGLYASDLFSSLYVRAEMYTPAADLDKLRKLRHKIYTYYSNRLNLSFDYFALYGAVAAGDARLLATCDYSRIPRRIFTDALCISAEFGWVDCCRLLIEKGADITGDCLSGAAVQLQIEVAQLLLESADLTEAEISHALYLVCSVSSTVDHHKRDQRPDIAGLRFKLARLLLKHGANVRGLDSEGNDALRLPLIYGELDLVRLLLDYGADPLNKDSNGESLLEFAEKFCSKKVVDLLRGRQLGLGSE